MTILKDGTGTGNTAKVSGNRMFSHTITESEGVHATEKGDAFNINTGTIGLTSTTASGVFFLQNNDARDLIIEAIAVGIGSAGTVTDSSEIKVIQNPTSVDFSTDVDMNANRNFGSSKTLSSLAYKGVEGSTVTGGTEVALFYQAKGGRLFAPIDLVLTKGDSLAITIDTQTTSGTTNIYAAAVTYLKEENYID
jgi:hypothetical protein